MNDHSLVRVGEETYTIKSRTRSVDRHPREQIDGTHGTHGRATDHDVSDPVVGPHGEDEVPGLGLTLADQETAVLAFVQDEFLGLLAGQVSVKPPTIRKCYVLVVRRDRTFLMDDMYANAKRTTI